MRGAARREMPTAIIAGYSVTCRGSFTALQYHLASIPLEASGACIVWLVAMKADSSNNERQVTRAEMDAFADSHPLLAPSRAFELDCRTGRGVSELLQHMASQFKVQQAPSGRGEPTLTAGPLCAQPWCSCVVHPREAGRAYAPPPREACP